MAADFPLRFEIDGVRFDLEDGIASVPNVVEIDHRGFVAYVRPGAFVEFCPEGGRDDTTWLADRIAEGAPIGMSYLVIDWTGSGPVAEGHEGRSRMKVLARTHSDVEFPVAVFLARGRARNLTEDMVATIAGRALSEMDENGVRRAMDAPLFSRYRLLGVERSVEGSSPLPGP